MKQKLSILFTLFFFVITGISLAESTYSEKHQEKRHIPKDTLKTQGEKEKMSTKKNGKLSISFQYRPRTEYRNGYKNPLADTLSPAFITSQRSRIKLGYSDSTFRSAISFQDVRTWGEVNIKQDLPSSVLHEAWLEWAANKKFSVKIGRQVLKYADQRLLAACNWNNTGATHDMMLFKYTSQSSQIHLGMAYNNDENRLFSAYNNYPTSFYKAMQFLYVSKQFTKNLKISLLEIADGHQKESTSGISYWRTTVGLNLDYTNNQQFNASSKAYWQGGKDPFGNRSNAYFLSLDASYAFNHFKATAGTDYFSGNDALDTTNQVNQAFDNLYGAGHRFYGNMDYFRAIEKHTRGGGLHDMYLKLGYKASRKTYAELAFHHFRLANRFADESYTGEGLKALDKTLGSELDFTVKYRPAPHFSVRLGYSAMFSTSAMGAIKGGNHKKVAHWGVMMLTFKPGIIIHNLQNK